MSPCGNELNFVDAAELPVVFGELVVPPTGSGAAQLRFAGSLHVDFDPHAVVRTSTGRLMHPSPVCQWGLLRDSLVMSLNVDLSAETGLATFDWHGQRIVIPERSTS